jgi:hypothetical protein
MSLLFKLLRVLSLLSTNISVEFAPFRVHSRLIIFICVHLRKFTLGIYRTGNKGEADHAPSPPLQG